MPSRSRRPRASRISRRTFLGGLAAAGVVACTSDSGGDSSGTSTTTGPLPDLPTLPDDPFTIGVASGDPLPDGVVLWTRLAPDPQSDAAMPDVDVPVTWELAADEGFGDVVQSGTAVTGPALAHSVHVDVRGLEPGRHYWYRFTVGSHESPVGRTWTAPATDASPERIAFAVASCQAYQSGYYTAYRHLADEDLDFVLFVGDYIYELEASAAVRPHGLAPPRTLAEFRTFYGLNKTDPDLQRAHAAFPWIVTWDDHEVEDNYADLEPGGVGLALDPDAAATFAAKRAAAYRAYWEHMPLRVGPPSDEDLRIYRDFRFGDLVNLPVLDDRQYRSPILEGEGAGNLPRGAGGGPLLPETFDESRTMLGDEQEAWLAETLERSDAEWQVIVQQTVMAEVDRAPGDPTRGFSMDAWDGYVAARRRLLGLVEDGEIDNVIVVGGDIHTSAVTDLKVDYEDPDSPVVASEFVGTSISALELLPENFAEATLTNDHIHLYDTEHRGYLRCEATRDGFTADFRSLSSATELDGTIDTTSSWTVEAGRPGAQPA